MKRHCAAGHSRTRLEPRPIWPRAAIAILIAFIACFAVAGHIYNILGIPYEWAAGPAREPRVKPQDSLDGSSHQKFTRFFFATATAHLSGLRTVFRTSESRSSIMDLTNTSSRGGTMNLLGVPVVGQSDFSTLLASAR